MMPVDFTDLTLSDAMEQLRQSDEIFAVATIVRTAGTTSAKPGAKALLRADGTLLQGWLGGGCVRGAVRKAALRAYETGRPQFISIAPEEELSDKGVRAGDDIDGVRFARNGCPSKGSIDVYIEPSLPQPELLIIGGSPVAGILASLSPQFGWAVGMLDPEAPLPAPVSGRPRFLVIATQGQGDLVALKTALATRSDYVAFVGSHKKFATLSEKLAAAGIEQNTLASVRAPAGLDICAVTPEEIALSILAELTQVRRKLVARAAQGG